MTNKATLGHRYRDPITNFEGIATSNHIYLTGCTRVTLEGINQMTGEPTGHTFDFPILIECQEGHLELPPKARAAGDVPG